MGFFSLLHRVVSLDQRSKAFTFINNCDKFDAQLSELNVHA